MDKRKIKKKSNKTKYAAFVLLALILTILTCTLPFWAGRIGNDDLASMTSLPNFSSPTEVLASGLTPTITIPPTSSVPTPTPQGGSGSTATGAACLPGAWNLNMASVTAYLTTTMRGNEFLEFSPKSVSGKIKLLIQDGQMFIEAQDFQVHMEVNISGLEDASDFSVIVQSTGDGSYTTIEDTQIDMTDISYEANGIMETVLANFDLDINDLHEIAKDLKFAESIPTMLESRKTSFTCMGDELTIQVNKHSSVLFHRILP